MSPLFFALAFAIVALLVYMGRYSGRVRAEASRFIAAPPEAVYAGVADLQRWQAWNPWLEHARDARPEIDGITLAWDVPEVGRGSVRQVMQRPGSALRQQFEFALPFACRGRSDWQFEPAPGGTRVTWRFKGRVAFTLRAFAATVQGATGLDLRFGLDRLAASLESAAPAYTLDYAGTQPQPPARFAQQLHRGPLDLASVVTDAVERARVVTADHAIDVGSLDEVEVYADRNRLLQALMQLVDNAVAVCPPGGRIAIGCTRLGARAQLWVRDQGPGIALADREGIFERHARATDSYDGTGLGLAIVAAIARAHGGDARVGESSPDGTTMVVEIPALAQEVS